MEVLDNELAIDSSEGDILAQTEIVVTTFILFLIGLGISFAAVEIENAIEEGS